MCAVEEVQGTGKRYYTECMSALPVPCTSSTAHMFGLDRKQNHVIRKVIQRNTADSCLVKGPGSGEIFDNYVVYSFFIFSKFISMKRG